jgi:hypothetical protein
MTADPMNVSICAQVPRGQNNATTAAIPATPLTMVTTMRVDTLTLLGGTSLTLGAINGADERNVAPHFRQKMLPSSIPAPHCEQISGSPIPFRLPTKSDDTPARSGLRTARAAV